LAVAGCLNHAGYILVLGVVADKNCVPKAILEILENVVEIVPIRIAMTPFWLEATRIDESGGSLLSGNQPT